LLNILGIATAMLAMCHKKGHVLVNSWRVVTVAHTKGKQEAVIADMVTIKRMEHV